MLFAAISITFSCLAGNRWDKFMAFCGYTKTSTVTDLPSISDASIQLTQRELANLYGGVFSQNLKDTGTIVIEGAKELMKNPEKTETAVQALSHGSSHGFMYGLLSGPASAVRDGVVYVKDTVVEHPVIAGATVTAGVAAAAYYKLRPLTPEEEHQENMRKAQRATELREAALIEKTDLTADELRTCLNTHAHCGDRAKNGIPRRCNSPAGRLAQLNRAVAKEIIDGFKEYR
jgi:hypothetical protein